jgi:hypothetical protein
VAAPMISSDLSEIPDLSDRSYAQARSRCLLPGMSDAHDVMAEALGQMEKEGGRDNTEPED